MVIRNDSLIKKQRLNKKYLLKHKYTGRKQDIILAVNLTLGDNYT